MTVEVDTSRVSYTGAGTTGPFTIPFYFLENADIRVIKVTIADGTEDELALTTDFTLTGAGEEEGGTLTLVSSLSSSFKLVIFRDPDVLQEADYPRNDRFPAETHEEVVDRLTMIAQRHKSLLERSVRLPDGDTSGTSMVLPGVTSRQSKFLAFDADGAITVVDGSDGTTGSLAVALAASGGSALVGFAQSGSGATDRTMEEKARDRKDAADYTTLPLGIANLITATGGLMELGQNTDYAISSTLDFTLPVNLRGAGRKSRLTGSGITITKISGASSGKQNTEFSNFVIEDSTGHASTIAVLLEAATPADGLTNWRLSRMAINGASGNKLGTGVKASFALDGVIDDCVIQYFGKGVLLDDVSTSKSNANWIHGTKIRENTVGVEAAGQDDYFIAGSLLEANSTGLLQSEGKGVVAFSHLENNLGDEKQIEVSAGTIVSIGNFFGHTNTTYRDIYISAGSSPQLSVGDTFAGGIRHEGTGGFLVVQPATTPTISGTGPVTVFTANSLAGTNQSAANFVISGFAQFDVRSPLVSTAGNTKISMSTGNRIEIQEPTGSEVASIDANGAIFVARATAIPAGGTTGRGVNLSSTGNFGVYFGSGAPTLAAAKGSLYLRSDGTTTNDRAYINTDGANTWTTLTTAA